MVRPKRRTKSKKAPALKSSPQRRAKAPRRVTRKTTGKSATGKRQDRRPAYEKAAIRSDAFAKAILDAKSYRDDPDSLRALFEEASTKAAAMPRTALNELGPYLQAMLRLIRAYARG